MSPRCGRRWPELDRANLGQVMRRSALVIGALQTATAAVAIPRRRRDYADAVWAPGLAAVALVGALSGTGDARRRWGLALLSGAWGWRLGSHMVERVRHKDEEDGRYREFLGDAGPAEVVAKVFLTQAVAQLVVSAPIQVAAASRLPAGSRRRLAWVGLLLMAAGILIEAEADAEKERYSAQPRESRPEVLDTGLWGWSRHPNYFGDSVIWDGAWLSAAASAPAALTLGAPVLMSYLLMYATGSKRTEAIMQERPGYRDYQGRVSFFFPTPPRRVR